MIDVLVAHMTMEESHAFRTPYEIKPGEGVLADFDPALNITRGYDEIRNLHVWSQRMTGRKILDQLEKIFVELEEGGRFQWDDSVGCPHAERDGVHEPENAMCYFGRKLLFCYDCHMLVKEAQLESCRDMMSTTDLLKIEGELAIWRMRHAKRGEAVPIRNEVLDQFVEAGGWDAIVAEYNPGGHGTVRVKL